MSLPEQPLANPSPVLVLALRHALRPFAKLMLSNGITLPYFVELLKSLLVDVAANDFQINDKPSTDSRVSLLSGVHRKDVNRIRHTEPADANAMPSVVSLGAQLVAQWLGNPIYADEHGQAKPLARNMSEGGVLSFEALVAGINSDIRSRVVLDEWLRLGVVHLDEQYHVCLNTQAFVPQKGFDEKAFYFGQNLHDHAAAASHNLLNGEPPFLDRIVHYKGLSVASVQVLEAQSKELGMQALLALNKTALEREKLDNLNEDTGLRMTFGVYFYSEPCDLASKNSVQSEDAANFGKP